MGDWTTLDTGDGAARAYVAGSADDPGVVVLHAWWGLVDDVTAYAEGLASAGFRVVAPDLVNGAVATTIEEAEALTAGADEAHADSVVLGAVDYLTSDAGDTPVGIIGFSFGAWWAIKSASERPIVRASVVYYGAVWGDFVADSDAAVLAHFGEVDEFEPEENVQTFENELTAAGRSVTVHRYDGLGHWFAEPSQNAYDRQAAERAYERTVEFLREELT